MKKLLLNIRMRPDGFNPPETSGRHNKTEVVRRSLTGFTIIELLIAMAVFSVVLLVLTTGMLQISRLYYKGITTAKTQETARQVMDEISRSIQFGGGTVTGTAAPAPGTTQYFCIGDKQYSYLLGKQLSDNPDPATQTKNALVVQAFSGGCGSASQNLLTGATGSDIRELLGPNMRLSKLELTNLNPPSDLWRLDLRIVHGEDDLLNPAKDNCGGARAGGQFCAASELRTVVKKRVR